MATTLHFTVDLTPESGGVYTTLSAFCHAFTCSHWERTVVSFDTTRSMSTSIDSTHIVRVPTREDFLGQRYSWPQSLPSDELENCVAAADIVFIHLLYRYHVSFALRLAEKHSKPVVVVPHGGLDPFCFTYRALPKRLWLIRNRHRLRRAWFLFATEAERTKAMAQTSSIHEDRTTVINWPTQFGEVIPEQPSDYGVFVRPERRRLLFAGRLHRMKRIEETIHAFVRLAPPDWDLIIAGPPSDTVSVRDLQLAVGEHWNKSVHYVGMLDRGELRWAMAKVDAFVLLSHRENFGHSVAEAMIEGLPVVVSDQVDIHPLVSEAHAGTVSEIRDTKDLIKALEPIFSMPPPQLREMGLRAASVAKRHFGMDVFSSRLVDFTRQVLREHASATVSH